MLGRRAPAAVAAPLPRAPVKEAEPTLLLVLEGEWLHPYPPTATRAVGAAALPSSAGVPALLAKPRPL